MTNRADSSDLDIAQPMKRKTKPHLKLTFSVEQPLFDESQLVALHRIINEHLPRWSTQLTVAKWQRQRPSKQIGPGHSLFGAIHEVAPPKSGIGTAAVSGTYRQISIFMMSCNSTLPPELNHISLEVLRLSIVEEQDLSFWARSMFETLSREISIRYAHAQLTEEFGAKNMVNDARGVWAIGVKLDVSLPGLYWLNYFGAPYVELIGEDRLLSAPAFAVHKVGAGIFMAVDESPSNWQSIAYKERESAIINHIGRDYFFLRDEPDRQLIAPDFRKHQRSKKRE